MRWLWAPPSEAPPTQQGRLTMISQQINGNCGTLRAGNEGQDGTERNAFSLAEVVGEG